MKIYKNFKNYLRSLHPSYYRKLNSHKVYVKYVISGGTAAFVDLVLLYALIDIFKVYYLLSASIAFLVAFFVSFYLQKFWTFRDNSREKIYKQISLYFAVGTTNVCINAAGMYVLVEHILPEIVIAGKFNATYVVSQIIMGAFIAVSSFLIYKFVIFKKKKKALKESKNNKLKILIATGIFPPDIGGPATMLKALADSLIKQNFAVKIITYSDTNIKQQKNDIEVNRVVKSQNIIFRHLKYFLKMYKLAKWADILYITDTYSVGRFAYLIKRILGKKYIVRFAGDSAWEIAVSRGWTKDYIVDFQKKIYNSHIEKLKKRRGKILIGADRIIAVSQFIAGIAKRIGVDRNKIRVIYNSVDFINNNSINTQAVENIKDKYGNNAKIVVTACRLTPWKGVDGIIKILPQLKEKVGDINFLVLGQGQELNNLKQLASKFKVESSVHFLGKVNHNEILNYFKVADLFILNTNYEGLSHTLLEAMRARTPIVTTNIGGNPEVIDNGKNGLLVNYNNQEELLEAATKILTNQQSVQNLSNNAKKKLEKFNWDNTVKETVKTLKEVYYE